jgi:hypothetical protein
LAWRCGNVRGDRQGLDTTLLIALPVAGWMAVSGRGYCRPAGRPRGDRLLADVQRRLSPYVRRFWPASGLYVVAIALATWLIPDGAHADALTVGIALLPGIAMVTMIWAMAGC